MRHPDRLAATVGLRPRSKADGSVSVLTAGVLVLACVLSLAAADVTGALSARARAQTAADFLAHGRENVQALSAQLARLAEALVAQPRNDTLQRDYDAVLARLAAVPSDDSAVVETLNTLGFGAVPLDTPVLGIVQQCGGSIQVSSELGWGTTFRYWSDGAKYRIVSCGSDARCDEATWTEISKVCARASSTRSGKRRGRAVGLASSASRSAATALQDMNSRSVSY